jgi:hypothetical protein
MAESTCVLHALSQLSDTSTREAELVNAAATSRKREFRVNLADLYRGGYFGERNAVAGYAWTLAAWNCQGAGYDSQFTLAESQQYYEFLLSAAEQSEAVRLLSRLIPALEEANFVPGSAFNAGWWGWEDDPAPSRPGSRAFETQFLEWLRAAGYGDAEAVDTIERCTKAMSQSKARAPGDKGRKARKKGLRK